MKIQKFTIRLLNIVTSHLQKDLDSNINEATFPGNYWRNFDFSLNCPNFHIQNRNLQVCRPIGHWWAYFGCESGRSSGPLKVPFAVQESQKLATSTWFTI